MLYLILVAALFSSKKEKSMMNPVLNHLNSTITLEATNKRTKRVDAAPPDSPSFKNKKLCAKWSPTASESESVWGFGDLPGMSPADAPKSYTFTLQDLPVFSQVCGSLPCRSLCHDCLTRLFCLQVLQDWGCTPLTCAKSK